jgi:hypothetical protein
MTIAEALSKDPSERPRDAHEFAVKLRQLQSTTTMPESGEAASEVTDSGESTRLADDHDQHPGTVVMSPDDGSRTAIMPEGHIVGGTPDFGLSHEAHASRRQRRRLGLAAIAAALLVFVLVLVHGADATKPLDLTPTTVATPASGPTVDPNVLVGLSTQQASDVLSQAGFVVAVNPVEAAGVPAGTVTGVEPNGQVPPGATVTLDVSNGAVASTTTTVTTTAAPERPRKKGHGKPNG